MADRCTGAGEVHQDVRVRSPVPDQGQQGRCQTLVLHPEVHEGGGHPLPHEVAGPRSHRHEEGLVRELGRPLESWSEAGGC
eukprot:7521181-Pyramimonas_sp.AAC.1